MVPAGKQKFTRKMIAATLAGGLFISCSKSDVGVPGAKKPATSKKDEEKKSPATNANDANILDGVIRGVVKELAGERLYEGLYRIKINIAFIECGGEFPITIKVPDFDVGIGSVLDFKGAKVKCAGFDLPLDDITKALFSSGAQFPQLPASLQGKKLFGLRNQEGVLGVTKLATVELQPMYPLLPDILDTTGEVLATLDKTVPVTLTSPKGTTDSGQTRVKVTSYNGNFQAPGGGQTFDKVMMWTVSASGYQKTVAGPHLLDTLTVGLNMDPLAVPHIDFTISLTTAGGSVFKTLRESWDGKEPEFFGFVEFVLGIVKSLDVKFIFSADMIKFVDNEPTPTPAVVAPPTGTTTNALGQAPK